ncbi:nitrate/nitrite transporter [Siccirubricoccus deserti]
MAAEKQAAEDLQGSRSVVALAMTCLCLVLSLATWFSATAVLPQLRAEWNLSDTSAAWLTIAVQMGFVLGAVGSATLGLADRVAPNRLMAVCATGAAIANAGLLLATDAPSAIGCRIATGVFLAGVYPPALKLLSTWFRRGRGCARHCHRSADHRLGIAASHRRLLDLGWRDAVLATTVATLIGAATAAAVLRNGPFPFPRTPFDLRDLHAVLANRPFRLATGGYLGHMWELYAMWAWLLVLVRLRLDVTDGGASGAALMTFAIIAAGAPACVLSGYLADRLGRPAVTIGALAISGACAALISFTFDGPLWLFATVGALWGASVIADSAQFSAMVTERCDLRLVGTALTIQLGCGFALTGLSIWLLPLAAEWLGSWRWVPLLLVPGPVLGILSIAALRSPVAPAQAVSPTG